MKRSIEYISLCEQRDALDAQCRECIRPLHEAVWELTDVIFNHLVQWIAANERVAVVGGLASINHEWQSMVARITHVKLGRNDWGSCGYERLFSRYVLVTSVEAHPNMLLENIGLVHVSHITDLRLIERDELDYDPVEYDVTGWIGLRCLCLPDGLDTYVKGLSNLTALTELTCSVTAFGDPRLGDEYHQSPETLLGLTRLQTLRVDGFDESLPFTKLPSLRELHSDRASHFVDYTGKGSLNTDDISDKSDTERALCATYDGALTQLYCHGEWRDGIFSGYARIRYGDDTLFWGNLLDNRRHGAGSFWNYEKREAYDAHWSYG